MSRLPSSVYVASVNRFKLNFLLNVTRFLSTGHSKVNHYEVLDVTQGSSQSEIKEAYYKLSKQYHPDRNPGDDNASNKFRKITEAYDVLSNVDSKRVYDRSLSIQDAKSSPYSSNYRPSPTFREVNRNTGKPKDQDDYTQFFRNRQAQLGRNQHTTSSFNPPNLETPEDAVNPFNIYVDPQPPPNKLKSYKYYSQSGWENPDKLEDHERKKGVTTPISILIVGFLVSSILGFSKLDSSKKYCAPPKS